MKTTSLQEYIEEIQGNQPCKRDRRSADLDLQPASRDVVLRNGGVDGHDTVQGRMLRAYEQCTLMLCTQTKRSPSCCASRHLHGFTAEPRTKHTVWPHWSTCWAEVSFSRLPQLRVTHPNRATRVQRRVHEVGHGHVCDRVPRVAEPGVHRGLGGQPVLVETTRAASLLTVQQDGESVANESETDMGDLTHWQRRGRTASPRTSILSSHEREKLGAASKHVHCGDRAIVRISEINDVAVKRI